MKTGLFAVLTLCLALFTSTVARAEVPTDRLTGVWANVLGKHGNLSRITITRLPSKALQIEVFGNCSPTACDWGPKPLATYPTFVLDHGFNGDVQATAYYDHKFEVDFLTLRVLKNGNLEVNTYSESHQSNTQKTMHYRDVFWRS